jgi:hypothetical protein
MRDYLTLHWDTNSSKGTACSKKWYGCKWTWETILTLHWDTNSSKGVTLVLLFYISQSL